MFRMPIYTALTAAALAILGSGQSAYAGDTITKEAVPLNEFQNCFNDFTSNGYMLVYIKGYVKNGKVHYDAVFEPQQPGMAWEAHHLLSDADWKQKDGDLRSLGYARSSSNHFTYNGKVYHASLWVKK